MPSVRRPTVLFLLLTFAWAWVLWGYWVFAMPPGGLVLSPAFLIMAIVGGLAPSLSALVVLRLTAGSAEAKALLGRLLDWSRPKGWYLVALLLGPLAAIAGWLAGARAIPGLVWPDLPPLLPVLLVWPLLAALGEELGWRGYLYPRLQARFGWLGAALILGVIWGLWHLPADFVGLKATGSWFWLAFLLNGPLVLTGHALVMAWLWSRTGGSLVAMVIYHLGVTASAIAAPSAGPDVPAQLFLAAIAAGAVWLLALALHLGAPIRDR
jgi:membrane protease YdiL (CAAX protease family)